MIGLDADAPMLRCSEIYGTMSVSTIGRVVTKKSRPAWWYFDMDDVGVQRILVFTREKRQTRFKTSEGRAIVRFVLICSRIYLIVVIIEGAFMLRLKRGDASAYIQL